MSPAPLRIGDPVQVHEETEVLTLVAIDGEHGWCRDGAGGHVTHRLEDLVRAKRRHVGYGETDTTMPVIVPSRWARYPQ